MNSLEKNISKLIPAATIENFRDQITLTLNKDSLLESMNMLKKNKVFKFDILIDISGIDYLHYGVSEWDTASTTATGYSRAVREYSINTSWDKPRIAVLYNLLSTFNNQRLRVKVYLPDSMPEVDSICKIYPHANWYEREAYDLFGIVFKNHPDLRRILTDYGFKGFPFRKDFPLIGRKEIRYDQNEGRCVYEDVSISSRTTVPKVIRDDNRYLDEKNDG